MKPEPFYFFKGLPENSLSAPKSTRHLMLSLGTESTWGADYFGDF